MQKQQKGKKATKKWTKRQNEQNEQKDKNTKRQNHKIKLILHTWQGAQRAPKPSAGARTRGPQAPKVLVQK